jgi:hypothetical protein
MYVVTPCGLVDGYKRFGEKHAVSIFRTEMEEVEDGDSTYVSPKRWYLPTSPYDVTIQKNNISTFAAGSSNVIRGII